MTEQFVKRCQELAQLTRGVGSGQSARMLSAMIDRTAAPSELAASALGSAAPAERVERLAECIETVVELAPAAIATLGRRCDEGPPLSLDREALAAVAPLAARIARRATAEDRRPAAALLSHLVDVAFHPELTTVFRRSLRALFICGPRDVSLAALPGLLELEPSFAADDALLGRLDLLLALGLPRAARVALGKHLALGAELIRLLLVDSAAGATPDRWRAAMLLGCIGDSADAVANCSANVDLVALGARLLDDESVPVWRAAAVGLGRLAAHLPAAFEALDCALAAEASLRQQRHAAPSLGALLLSHPEVAQQRLERILSRGTDPWLVGSLVFALPEIAERDLDRFSSLLERLCAARGPAVPANLAAMLCGLSLRGHQEAVSLASPMVIEAVEAFKPRDPTGVALRWSAVDALAAAGVREAPPSFGAAALTAARATLDVDDPAEVQQAIDRALALGWAQLRRIDEPDTSVGLQGRGRLLFEIRDLAEALFDHDLLFAAFGARASRERAEDRPLIGDYEQLRGDTCARLDAGLARFEQLDRHRCTEIARAITSAFDSRASNAAALPDRLTDRAAAARNLGWFDALVTVARRPDRRMRRVAASGLARFFSRVARYGDESLLAAVVALVARSPDADLLAAAAKLAEGTTGRRLSVAARVVQSWSQEADRLGAVTAENLRRLGQHAASSVLRDGLQDVAAAIEDFAGRATTESLSTSALATTRGHPADVLAEAVRQIATAVHLGIDGLRVELYGSSGSDEAERIRRRIQRAHREAARTSERVERAVRALLEQGEELAATTAPPVRVNLTGSLAASADDLVGALREGIALPIGEGFAHALEGWRDALTAEAAAARQAISSVSPGATGPEATAATAETDDATADRQAGEPAEPAVAVAETVKAPEGGKDAFPPTFAVRPGARIGDYQLINEIGQGGMGLVWKARQISLDRHVAFKLLRAETAASPDGRERFRQEARIMGRWCHDNILRVIDYQDRSSPIPYMVTELVAGQSLYVLFKRGKLMPARVVEIGQLVARGLAHAHAAGVVHRDLSPDNVMIRDDGQVLLMDFGIARLLGVPRKPMSQYFIGKPDYASPQHLSGEPELGPETDVYALGVMLYQLLARELPFPGPTVDEIRGQKLREAAKPLAEVCPGLPADLCALVHRMLAAEAGSRPTAAEAAFELAQIGGRMAGGAEDGEDPTAADLHRGEISALCLRLCNLERGVDQPWFGSCLGWWYRTAREMIERRGGVCDRHISERVYGFFGTGPAVTAGDRCSDLALAALQAVCDVEARVRSVARERGWPIQLRAGAAMGPAVFGKAASASPLVPVAGGLVERAERLAASDLDQASLRTDERLRNAAGSRVAFLKRQGSEPGCGRVYFVEFVEFVE